ncbi:IS200/IS605 family transposase [Spirosoma soli]|uniref:IS200/IS605 family transposase n=1 Tax=Spirosoma soli TaxID=1770529 RepID=A0ABW5M1B6_9BACT
MPNTYTQLYAQIVFAVKGHQSLIPRQHKDELYGYMTAVVHNHGAKMLAIHCMPDHVHIFIGFGPTLTMADLVRDVKASSSGSIKEQGWVKRFSWQEGYGAFTYVQS